MNARDQVADIVIVGAGASGSVMAAELAGAGRRIVILESGPPWSPKDLYNSQLWSRRLRWGGPAVRGGGQHPFSHNFNIGWGFGGTALHHYACWPRMAIEDFREHSLYGRGADWPLDYDALRPFYDRIQHEVGISGDADKEIWRPPGAPYPMGPLATFRHGELIAEGFAKLGLATSPQPMAINSEPYGGRPACQYDGWCDSGCAILALAHPLALYLPKAIARGVELRSHVSATRVLTDATTRKANGVEYADAQGIKRILRAKLVILAANAIQNARLLLNSGNSAKSDGLANGSGLVGRRFMYHSNVSLVGEFNEETQNYAGPVAGTLHSREGYGKVSRQGNIYGSSMWHIGLAIKPNDVLGMANWHNRLIGADLKDFLEHRAPRMANLVSLCQMSARDENRIELTSERDRNGVPLARVTTSLDENDFALRQSTENLGLRIMNAAGAKDAWVAGYGSSHALGGTPMGLDPKTSVTDEYGFTHDVENLVLAGAGLYPTAGAVNPTFTIHAIAQRSAEHIGRHWASLS